MPALPYVAYSASVQGNKLRSDYRRQEDMEFDGAKAQIRMSE